MDCSNDPGCCQPKSFARRDFLKLAGVVTLGALTTEWVFAGPFQVSDFANSIPANKKFRPE